MLKNGRTPITTALAGIVATATAGLMLSIPGSAQAEPDIDDVRERVDRLYHEAELASERYNDAKLELTELNEELQSLESDEARQGDRLADVRSDVRDAVLQTYQGNDLGAAGDLLGAESGSFMSELTTMSTVNDLQDALLADYNDELKAYTIRREETESRRDQVADLEEQLAEEKAEIDAKAAEAEDLLDELEAEEREDILSRGGTRAPSEVPAEGRAAAAIKEAVCRATVWFIRREARRPGAYLWLKGGARPEQPAASSPRRALIHPPT